jgi:hypothetical protein
MRDERMGLAGTLALLAASVAVLFGVALSVDPEVNPDIAGAPAGPSEPAATLDSDELLRLGLKRAPTVARRVSRIRGIEFDRIPEPQVTDTAALRDLASKGTAKPRVAEKLAAGDAELKLLGLLEPDQSLAEVATEVTAQAAAYYDPRKGELFLLGDAVPAGPALAEFVLAHELTHALEDEAFGLPPATASSDDRVLAESALVEGSATALMTEYASKYLAPGELFAESAGLPAADGGLPPIALAQVNFTYIEGQAFVNELREAVRGRWDLVDFAYEGRAPKTTEQILHPEKYLDDEGALPVPGLRSPGRGWVEGDSGTVGEFFTRELLEQGEDVDADEAAAGWGGDYYRFFWQRSNDARECSDDCREQSAMAIVWRGDDGRETADLEAALETFAEAGLGGQPAADGAWELDGGWVVVRRTGDVVTVAFAPEELLARRLARPRGRASG